jgi:hypothetical protein
MPSHLGVAAKTRYGQRSRPQMAASFIRLRPTPTRQSLLSRTRVYASPLDMRHLNHGCRGDPPRARSTTVSTCRHDSSSRTTVGAASALKTTSSPFGWCMCAQMALGFLFPALGGLLFGYDHEAHRPAPLSAGPPPHYGFPRGTLNNPLCNQAPPLERFGLARDHPYRSSIRLGL